jgi:hypothetical protein
MEDEQIMGRISALVDEEERLRYRRQEAPLSAEELRRVQQIEVALDQCWDLLRQRRARREYGEDPNAAGVRDAETVERYVQ